VNKCRISSLHQFFFTYWEKTPVCLHCSSCLIETRNNEHLNTQGRLHQQPRQDPVKRLRGDIIIKVVMLVAARSTAVPYSLVNRCCMSSVKIHGFASHKSSVLSDMWYLRAPEEKNCPLCIDERMPPTDVWNVYKHGGTGQFWTVRGWSLRKQYHIGSSRGALRV